MPFLQLKKEGSEVLLHMSVLAHIHKHSLTPTQQRVTAGERRKFPTLSLELFLGFPESAHLLVRTQNNVVLKTLEERHCFQRAYRCACNVMDVTGHSLCLCKHVYKSTYNLSCGLHSVRRCGAFGKVPESSVEIRLRGNELAGDVGREEVSEVQRGVCRGQDSTCTSSL